MRFISYQLLGFHVIGALTVLVDSSPFVPRTRSKSATPRQYTQRENFIVFAVVRLEVPGKFHSTIFNLDVALDDGQNPGIAQRVLKYKS